MRCDFYVMALMVLKHWVREVVKKNQETAPYNAPEHGSLIKARESLGSRNYVRGVVVCPNWDDGIVHPT